MFLVGNWAPGLQTQDVVGGGMGGENGKEGRQEQDVGQRWWWWRWWWLGFGEEKLQVVRRSRRPEDMRETPAGDRLSSFFFPALLVSDEDVGGEERQVERGLQRVSD